MEIGKINKLTVARATDNGYYLVDEYDNEVLWGVSAMFTREFLQALRF